MRSLTTLILVLLVCSPAFARETVCDDRIDDDGDSMVDCADADCFNASACEPDGGAEASDERCSDWIDNDENGYIDCDDEACSSTNACAGSFDLKRTAQPVAPVAGAAPTSAVSATQSLPAGMSPEDLLGTQGDIDGERNDRACSDGIDNDGDGFIDCADLGCRFAPDVAVCRDTAGMRFSLVGRVAQNYDLEAEEADTRFTRLQLRALGQIPGVQDSFFLINVRGERTPRLTFALFQVPLGSGHYFNLNSGGGALSNALIISTAKQLLLEPAFYMLNAFEQNNGAAAEILGPLSFVPGTVFYRFFAAGGSGQFNGNVGGRFFNADLTNFTYSVGGQFELQLYGYFDRFDTPFIYTPAATALVVRVGGRYDQRVDERFAASNVSAIFRWNRLHLSAENYTKREFEFGSWQYAYNLQAAVLVVPKWLLLAADFGQFERTEFDDVGALSRALLRDRASEWQFRAAAHVYFYRSIGILTVLYDEAHEASAFAGDDPRVDRELSFQAQYRF